MSFRLILLILSIFSVNLAFTKSTANNFSSSNLPIVIINTNGQEILDSPRIIAHMGIIDNGEGNRNLITDSLNNYNGRISIEIRGQPLRAFSKNNTHWKHKMQSAKTITYLLWECRKKMIGY